MSHPAEGLDEVVHQRTRLGILAVLTEADRAQFGFLKSTLSLTDGNLSRHLSILEAAVYVTIEKGYEGKRPRTWVSITKQGRSAYAAEIRSLRSLIQQFEEPPPDARQPGRDRDAEPEAFAVHAPTAGDVAPRLPVDGARVRNRGDDDHD